MVAEEVQEAKEETNETFPLSDTIKGKLYDASTSKQKNAIIW